MLIIRNTLSDERGIVGHMLNGLRPVPEAKLHEEKMLRVPGALIQTQSTQQTASSCFLMPI